MFKKFFIKVQAYLAMRSKIAEARSLYKKDGKRRFIIPFKDGNMDVLTHEEAMALKAANILPIDLTAKTLYNACFFYTATDEKHRKIICEMPDVEVSRRKEFYYKWFINHHYNEKNVSKQG